MYVPKRVRRRDRLYIIAEILDLGQTPVIRSRIMYKATLSFAQLNEYIKLLLERGLLEVIRDKDNGRVAYITTKKGLRVLHAYNEIRKGLDFKAIFEDDEVPVSTLNKESK